MALSLGLFIANRKKESMFIGQWAPSLLVIGLYNKIVKVAGHDKNENADDDWDSNEATNPI